MKWAAAKVCRSLVGHKKMERKVCLLAYLPFGGNIGPAVTTVHAGTTTMAHHMLANIGGGIGRVPDEAARRRMAELVDSWPQINRRTIG